MGRGRLVRPNRARAQLCGAAPEPARAGSLRIIPALLRIRALFRHGRVTIRIRIAVGTRLLAFIGGIRHGLLAVDLRARRTLRLRLERLRFVRLAESCAPDSGEYAR